MGHGPLAVVHPGAGFGQATVYRARRQLGDQVADSRGRNRSGNQWSLAEEEAGDA
jgi:hypothetical protein